MNLIHLGVSRQNSRVINTLRSLNKRENARTIDFDAQMASANIGYLHRSLDTKPIETVTQKYNK